MTRPHDRSGASPHSSPNELDRLLARGQLSRPTKDRLLTAALRSAAPPPARRWLGWRVLVPSLAALALAPFVVLHSLRPAVSEFGERGAAGGAIVDVGCAGDCRPGATLVFRTQAVREHAYLAAYAVGPDQSRIWYFPTASGELAEVAPHDPPEVLGRGGRIGSAQALGRWDVHVLLLRKPLGRDAILSLDESTRDVLAASHVPLEVHAP